MPYHNDRRQLGDLPEETAALSDCLIGFLVKTKEGVMGFLQAVEAEIEKLRARWEAEGPSSFDAWDKAEIEYLEGVRDELAGGVAPQAVHERLQADLPTLEEQVAREEACYTFDWYDDHYYEKIFSGRLRACRTALELYEKGR